MTKRLFQNRGKFRVVSILKERMPNSRPTRTDSHFPVSIQIGCRLAPVVPVMTNTPVVPVMMNTPVVPVTVEPPVVSVAVVQE